MGLRMATPKVSILTPARGCPQTTDNTAVAMVFQFSPPRGGVGNTDGQRPNTTKFQFSPPRGGVYKRKEYGQYQKFQFSPPRGGVITLEYHDVLRRLFQFSPPRGGVSKIAQMICGFRRGFLQIHKFVCSTLQDLYIYR